MANLDASQWNDLQVSGAENEKRFAELGLIDAVKESTPFVDYIPESARQALQSTSSLRATQIPIIKDQTVTVVQTPGFEFIPSNLEESDVYSFNAVDVFSGFRHYPANYANNMIDEQPALDAKMKNIAYACGNTIESLLSATLETRKTQKLAFTTQLSQGLLGGTYVFDEGDDTLKIDKAAQQETMFSSINEIMAANELPGSYRYVTSRAGLAVQKLESLKFGDSNDKNIQTLGMVTADRMHSTGNIAAGSDVFNGFALRDGSIGVYENYPHDFANGTEFAGKKWSISDTELPFARMRANIFVNNEATNAESLITTGTDSNLTMTHFKEMAIWFRFYQVFRYNETLAARPNDIVKIKGLTT